MDDDLTWLERLEIEYSNSDILSEQADGVVVPVMDDLTPYGKISRELWKRGGTGLLEECERLRTQYPNGRLPLRQAVTIDADRTEIGKLVVVVAWWSHASEYSVEHMELGFTNVIRQGLGKGLTTLACPVFATEGRHGALATAVARVLEDFDELVNSSTFSLERITFVCSNKGKLETFREHLQRHI